MASDAADAADPLGPFVTHVVALWRAGAPETERARSEAELRALAAASLGDAAGRDPERAAEREARVQRLLDDPPLLAAIFQNMDLLFGHRARESAGLSSLVLEAVERARDAEERRA